MAKIISDKIDLGSVKNTRPAIDQSNDIALDNMKVSKIDISSVDLNTINLVEELKENLNIHDFENLRIINLLKYHKTVLNSVGIFDISKSGSLLLDGILSPSLGVCHPGLMNQNSTMDLPGEISESGGVIIKGGRINASIVDFNSHRDTKIEDHSILHILPAITTNLTTGGLRSTFPYGYSYLIANVLQLSPFSSFLIDNHITNLIIIANQIITGPSSINITWNQPVLQTADSLNDPNHAGPNQTGIQGAEGNTGSQGMFAPSIEIWTLNSIKDFAGNPISSPLIVNIKGQDGSKGGQGQKGGKGGSGQNGVDSVPGRFECKSGPGSGSPGGRGGNGGEGGNGGNGGNGGQLQIFTPVITDFSNTILINAGGNGGSGGFGGNGGEGGSGGNHGAITGFCANSWLDWSDRTNGPQGATGTQGLQGLNGINGLNGPILSVNQINVAQFNQFLTSPGIIDLTPSKVKVNNSISLNGINFSASDQILLGGTTLASTFNIINGNQIHTVSIPDIQGGFHSIYVKNLLLNTSNVVQCYILPYISSISPTRVKPGQNILLFGNGFTPNCKVYLNNQQVPSNYIDKNSISLTVLRPNSLTLNADGEIIDVKLRDNYNNDSNLIQITLDTYRIYFLGDSIMAGQGHSEDRMFSELLSRHLQSQHPDIGVYYTNLAHSGATIESDSGNNYSNLDKEIPRSFPSIKSQLNSIINSSSIINQNVEHIIMDGGINDMEIMTFLKPSTSQQELATKLSQITNLAEQYAYGSMKQLLHKIAQNFPSTNVIVVGYYQVISNKSVAMRLVADYLSYHVSPFLPLGQSIPMLTGFSFSTVVKQCQHAKDELNRCNLKAVVEMNASLSSNQFKFVIPNFTEDNALFAQDTFLWGFDIFGDVEDPLKKRRDIVCVHPVLQANNDDKTFCRMASVGHPNNKGIQEYFSTISAIM